METNDTPFFPQGAIIEEFKLLENLARLTGEELARDLTETKRKRSCNKRNCKSFTCRVWDVCPGKQKSYLLIIEEFKPLESLARLTNEELARDLTKAKRKRSCNKRNCKSFTCRIWDVCPGKQESYLLILSLLRT